MDNRYCLILSNNNFYREVQLPPTATQYRVGTAYECDCRFAKERFFTEFELVLQNVGDTWAISCRKGDIYFQDKGAMKLKSCKLSHGSELQVMFQYRGIDQLLFKISYILDFEAEKANYERVLDIAALSTVTFGRERNCDIVLDDPLLGRDTVRLERRKDGLHLVDCGTRYGVNLNGSRINGEEPLRDYDFFSILGFSFYYKDGELYTSKHTRLYPGQVPCKEISQQNNHLNYPQFNRNTQVKAGIPTDDIVILDPPAMPQKQKQNIIMTLLPSLAMIALVVVMRGIMGGGNMSFVLYSAATMGLGVVTTVIGFINGNKEYKENTQKREEEYTEYIKGKRKEIRAARDNERALLENAFISPEAEVENVQNFSGTLFDRTPADEEFLMVRIGTGSRRAVRKISYKAKEQITISDQLAEQPRKLDEEFGIVENVPIVIGLSNANAIGVVGNNAALYEINKQLIVDICTRQYQDDVRMFILSENDLEEFAWVRWLPHFTDEKTGLRGIACTSEERTALLEYLYSELLHRSQEKAKAPHLVILVYDCPSFKNHPISKFINKAASLGVSFLFFEQYRELLPQYCSRIITLEDRPGDGYVEIADGSSPVQYFTYKSLPTAQAEAIAQKLAPVYCEEISLEGTLTKNISFFDMVSIFTVDDLDLGTRWSSAEIYKTMASPIGVKTGNELVYLDLHEKAHGPHGLVAGTTGSGKSEALQTYILSMAINYHPYEVGFVIIDFKGGGMANQFQNLPHLVGAITNIDGREIDRSLKSIKAELQKRQRVFAECGVNNIGNYIKKYKAGEVTLPLPHLIIVVDEFAELKAEQPEFMKELISAARIGRSLGVHLILATQKPSGQVNEQIWSNSRFKLCLKVQTPEDSNEVLKSPLAAEIKEPGRAYLQVGNNELFELFQSAYSGAPAAVSDFGTQKDFNICTVSIGGKRKVVYQQKKKKADTSSSVSQLDAIVEYVGGYCRKSGIDRLPQICLPSLADVIPWPEGSVQKSAEYSIPVGVYDDPDNQYQGIADISIADSNLLIIGSTQMGKTSLLQVIIRQLSETYSPKELALYIMDFGAMSLRNFERLNHVGGVVTASEDEKLKNLFKLLNEEIEQRKQKLADSGLSSFKAYREAGNDDLPLIVLMMDNFSVFKELYSEDYEPMLMYFVREGITYGLSIIMTNTQTTGLGFRYMSNIGNRIALTCNDKGEYSSVLDRCRMEPKNVPGRALFSKDKNIYEFQTYQCFSGEKEIERVEKIRAFVEKTNEEYEGKSVKQIPSIPEIVSISYIRQNYPAENVADNISIALDYSTIECVNLNCAEQLILGVAGKNAASRQKFVDCLLSDIHMNIFRRSVSLYIIDNFKKEFSAYKDRPYTAQYTVSAKSITDMIETIADELSERSETLEEDGIEAMQEMPWIIMIVNNRQAFDVMAGSRTHENLFTDICKKYATMKILFLFTDLADASINSSSSQMLRRMKDDKKLLYFGSIKEMKIIDLYSSVTKGLGGLSSVDDAYLLNGENIYRVKTIQEV